MSADTSADDLHGVCAVPITRSSREPLATVPTHGSVLKREICGCRDSAAAATTRRVRRASLAILCLLFTATIFYE
jgi:hypothetical protein